MLINVSVIIPAYNAEQFIGKTIDSVIRQSYKDWELIIVNDGSTDCTQDEIDKINDPRIRSISILNGGVSNARNVGFENSKGKYVAFLDADDLWHEQNLSKKLEILSEDDFGLVHSNCNVVDEDGRPNGEVKRGKSGYILEDLLLWNGTCIPAPSSILVKSDVVREIGGFNEKLSTAADQEFFFRVAAKYSIGHIDEVTWDYRVHGNNMHQNIKRMETDHILAYKLAAQHRLFKSHLFKKKCFSNLYLILAGSWWINANRNPRTFILLLRSFISYPLNFLRIIKKLF